MLEQQTKYAIRKTLSGVGSVVIGSLLMGNVAFAEEAGADVSGDEVEVVSSVITVDELESMEEVDQSIVDSEVIESVDLNEDGEIPEAIADDEIDEKSVSDKVINEVHQPQQEVDPTYYEEGFVSFTVDFVYEYNAIPYESIAIERDDLPSGFYKEIQEGRIGIEEVQLGYRRRYYTDLEDGTPYSRKVSVFQEPIDHIYMIGIGEDIEWPDDDFEGEDIVEEVIELPYETEVIYDDTLPEGQGELIQKGVLGEKVITITTPTFVGEPDGDSVVTEEITKDPVKEIIRIGTGIVDRTIEEETIEVPYEIERIDTPNLPKGEEQLIQEGVVGEKVVTTTTPTLNGEPSGDPVVAETITKDSVNEIIEVGTGIVSEDVTEETVEIPYDTEIIYDESLAEGEEVVDTKGEVGEKYIITTTPTLNEEPSGEAVVTEEVVKEPVTEVIRVGTGVVSEGIVVSGEEIPYETEIVEDPTLPQGEERVVQAGVVGGKAITTKTPLLNGEVSGEAIIEEEIITKPVNEIIHVGVGVVGAEVVEEIVEIPFDTEEIEDFNLPEGERVIEQAGVTGEKVIVTTTPTLNGQASGEGVLEESITKEPINEIIRIGTGITGEKIKEDIEAIPFETEIIEDVNLPQGEEVIEQRGVSGKKTITTTVTTLNGEPFGDPVVEEVVTKESVTEIIRVGTGTTEEGQGDEDDKKTGEVKEEKSKDEKKKPSHNVGTKEQSKETGNQDENKERKDKEVVEEESEDDEVRYSGKGSTNHSESNTQEESEDNESLPQTGELSTALFGIPSLLAGFGLLDTRRRNKK